MEGEGMLWEFKLLQFFNLQIINDASTRGKCYGFVTFRNPRSAIHAINEMDGRTVDGRVIRVKVWTRGGRLGFGRDREGFGQNVERAGTGIEIEIMRGVDQERDRRYDRERDYDQVRDHFLDRDRHQDRDLEDVEQGQSRNHDQGWERDGWYISLSLFLRVQVFLAVYCKNGRQL
ncbi:unnamed protein product [Prunus armeniaca]|uniref:RRM domain-containing protein n=1 Tax=Prunus armeniaca TaxID=36596 RepID=A0A6J5WG92_PRUAR|nr:hypothetical protein GBA52_026315 [Prunus armeniaca]CAB4274824.1 unnamed protein product [Prunus armeniaca]CAB4300790.1 unnamed protein product [Prunus armeniaca]